MSEDDGIRCWATELHLMQSYLKLRPGLPLMSDIMICLDFENAPGPGDGVSSLGHRFDDAQNGTSAARPRCVTTCCFAGAVRSDARMSA
eukprot:366546-Chlamydomonas_euryale.AAC.23